MPRWTVCPASRPWSADARSAQKWWHRFFFVSPKAEPVITADPLGWYRPGPERMGEANHADPARAITFLKTTPNSSVRF